MQTQTTNNEISLGWTGKVYDKCVIGIDRDGVINVDASELGLDYVSTVDQFSPIESSLEAIALIRSKGHRIAVISNQGGIAKGLLTEEEVDSVHDHMLKLLGEAGCPSIDAIYYSASSQKDDMFAKPNTGMFKRCENEHKGIKFSRGYYVGDKLSDLKAAMKMGSTPILVRTGHGIETEKQLKKFTYRDIRKKTKIFDNLYQFAETL